MVLTRRTTHRHLAPRGRERGIVMATGRFQLLAAAGLLAAAAAASAPGCSSPGPIASRRNSVGMLKASVSQLEYSNDNLKKKVASLQSDVDRAENLLAQKEAHSNDLAARLDDAKEVIRRHGGDVTALNVPASKASTASAESEIPPPARSQPVRRSNRSRKPPAAQIPRADPATSPEWDGADPGPQASQAGDDGRWLPVARGAPARFGGVTVR